MSSRSLKNYAHITPIVMMSASIQERLCNSKCCHRNQTCIPLSTMEEIVSIQTEYWGSASCPPPLNKDRREKNISLFDRARYDHDSDEFLFDISKVPGTKEYVCENAFVKLCGISSRENKSEYPDLWKDARKSRRAFLLQEDPELAPDMPLLGRSSVKFNDCISYIKIIIGKFRDVIGKAAASSGCDTTPDGAAALGVMIVPHESVAQLYEEFSCYRLSQNYDPSSIAGLSTFTAAYNQMESEGHVRLLGCKGSFPTCDICNNCNDLLRNANRKNRPEDLEVILDFKRAHLSQQELERRHMDLIKDTCRTVDSKGRPLALFICPDGMTDRRTRVPKEHKDNERHGKEQKYLTNRIMGVDVVCGPKIDTKILLHLDGFVPGGANLMAEVLRLVQFEVGKLLAKDGHPIPKIMYWQMDNCGENKNKGKSIMQKY